MHLQVQFGLYYSGQGNRVVNPEGYLIETELDGQGDA
jgi:hypothetical protein